MYRVAIYLHEQTSLYNASHALAGLFGLAELGEAQVNIVNAGFAAPQPAVLQLLIENDECFQPRRMAIDLLDRSDMVDRRTLEACDVYFKRSYFASDAGKLAKVRPWGLNFPCHLPASRPRRWPLIARCFARRAGYALFRGPAAALCLAREIRQFANLPQTKQFEVTPAQPLEPLVLFQTRLWEPHETAPDDSEEINRLRIDVVRALRHACGKNFIGGLVATPLAQRLCPDEIVPASQSRMANYAVLSRRAPIGVYTRGLHHSTAFKLAEYLAGSKAIVAEGLRNDTPVPLARGRHWLEFQQAEECVELCRQLLRDPERCAELRRAAGEYYDGCVEPVAHLRWTLAAGCGELAPPAPAIASRELEAV